MSFTDLISAVTGDENESQCLINRDLAEVRIPKPQNTIQPALENAFKTPMIASGGTANELHL
jgi:hypothetical protein